MFCCHLIHSTDSDSIRARATNPVGGPGTLRTVAAVTSASRSTRHCLSPLRNGRHLATHGLTLRREVGRCCGPACCARCMSSVGVTLARRTSMSGDACLPSLPSFRRYTSGPGSRQLANSAAESLTAESYVAVREWQSQHGSFLHELELSRPLTLRPSRSLDSSRKTKTGGRESLNL